MRPLRGYRWKKHICSQRKAERRAVDCIDASCTYMYHMDSLITHGREQLMMLETKGGDICTPIHTDIQIFIYYKISVVR
jgi:hypothetical protein